MISHLISLSVIKTRRVGPIDNTPSTPIASTLCKKRKENIYIYWFTFDMWHLSRDMWSMMHDTWKLVNLLSKFQLPSTGTGTGTGLAQINGLWTYGIDFKIGQRLRAWVAFEIMYWQPLNQLSKNMWLFKATKVCCLNSNWIFMHIQCIFGIYWDHINICKCFWCIVAT